MKVDKWSVTWLVSKDSSLIGAISSLFTPSSFLINIRNFTIFNIVFDAPDGGGKNKYKCSGCYFAFNGVLAG